MKKFLVAVFYLVLAPSLWATDFSLNPARDFGAIRRINPTDYEGKSVVREDGTGLSSDTAAAFRAALEVFSKAEVEPAGAVADHAADTSTHGVATVAGLLDVTNLQAAANASDALLLRLDGSRAMTGNLRLGGKWLSNDGGDEGVYVTTGGNVLINTTTDDGVNKLQVNGHAAAQSFRINNNEAYYCKDTGGTNRAIAFISSGNVSYFGHTSYPTRINSNGTLTHNGNTVWDSGNDGAGSGLAADTVPNATPASATATGTAGSIRYDANYIYICVAANTWKRVAISTW